MFLNVLIAVFAPWFLCALFSLFDKADESNLRNDLPSSVGFVIGCIISIQKIYEVAG